MKKQIIFISILFLEVKKDIKKALLDSFIEDILIEISRFRAVG